MTEPKNPLERAVDMFVYAPIGLAVLARDLGTVALADLAKRGRSEIDQTQKRVGNQITQYRFVGQYAVDQEIKPRVAPLVDELRRVVDRFTGGVPDATEAKSATEAAPTTAPASSFTPEPTSSNGLGEAVPATPTQASVHSTIDHAAAREAAAALPITDYDELSASQVVERLAGLTPSELQAIAGYEGERRRRKTILTRVEQLTR